MSQAYNISDLNPVIPPEPVVFEAVTIGWYILGALIFIFLVLFAFFRFRAWKKRKYRRDAIRQISKGISSKILSKDQRPEGILQLSEVLKSVAIKSYPEKNIAEKSGNIWTKFLSESCKKTNFNHRPGSYLSEIQYRDPAFLESIDPSQLLGLIQVSKKWIGGHRV